MKKANEGDLYKVVELGGRVFELRYGYYADYERDSAFGDPIPIYPNLQNEHVHTDEGFRIVTQMQTVCQVGRSRFKDGLCVDCLYFHPGEDLFGICSCETNRQKRKHPTHIASTEDSV